MLASKYELDTTT